MASWADFINECHKTKITQTAPTALPNAAETLRGRALGSSSTFINETRAATSKRSSSLPACRYDPVLHQWRLNGAPTESGSGAALGTMGSPGSTSGGGGGGMGETGGFGMPARSSIGRAGKALATTLTFRPDNSLNTTFGKLFGPPPENESPRRLRRPAPLAILLKDGAGKATRRDHLDSSVAADGSTRTLGDSTIVAPRPVDPDMRRIAEKYWRTHNYNPTTGRYWDPLKEQTISSVEEREQQDRTARRYARMPGCWKEMVDRGPTGAIFAPDAGVTTELLRTGKRFHIQK